MEDYLACVASVDDNVGRITDWLRERGDLDDTIVIYSSDQGFFLGDHGWFDKRFMYEESIRMPFVLSYPRAVGSGQALDRIVTNVDIAPTLLEAAGVEVPPRMQGRSFWRDLTGTAEAQADRESDRDRDTEGFYYRYWMHDDRSHQVGAHYGYRTHRYTLIFFYNDGLGLPGCSDRRFAQEWELYDLEADPEELAQRRRRPGLRAGARRARGADVAGPEGGRRRPPSGPARPATHRPGPHPRLNLSAPAHPPTRSIAHGPTSGTAHSTGDRGASGPPNAVRRRRRSRPGGRRSSARRASRGSPSRAARPRRDGRGGRPPLPRPPRRGRGGAGSHGS